MIQTVPWGYKRGRRISGGQLGTPGMGMLLLVLTLQLRHQLRYWQELGSCIYTVLKRKHALRIALDFHSFCKYLCFQQQKKEKCSQDVLSCSSNITFMHTKFSNVSECIPRKRDKQSDNYSIVVQQCTDRAWELTIDVRRSNDSDSSLGVGERGRRISRGQLGTPWPWVLLLQLMYTLGHFHHQVRRWPEPGSHEKNIRLI